MPKAAFSTTAFQAATPGMSRLAMALGGGGNTYETAKNNEVLLQSRLAQQLASQNLNDAKAAEIQDELSRGTPEAVRRNVMTGFNIPQAEEREFSGWLDTGKPSGRYALPADDVGPVLPAPEWSKNLAAPARAIMALNNALALGDKNSANVAKATGEFRDQALGDAIINGTANRNTVGGAQAAVAGKPLFHADANGSVLDQFAGNLDTSNPMAAATIGLRQKQGAAADALTAQRKSVAPGGKVPVGYRYTTGEDGELKLEPIPGGPKDPNAQTGKPLPASAAKGFLENHTNLARAQKALALVQGNEFDGTKGDSEATGMKGILPMQVLNRMDPKGVDTRAAIADLGSLVIHDRSGAAVTASEFPRLAPFIPTVYDDQKTSEKKLKLFVQNYKAIVDDAADVYKQSGYNVPAVKDRSGPAAPAAPGAPASNGWGIEKVE